MSVAHAVTVVSVAKGSLGSPGPKFFYATADAIDSGTANYGLIDAEAGYSTLNEDAAPASVTANGDSTALAFDVQIPRAPASGKVNVLVVAVSTRSNPTVYQAVNLHTAATTTDGNFADPSSGYKGINFINANDTKRIYLYPSEMCADLTGSAPCVATGSTPAAKLDVAASSTSKIDYLNVKFLVYEDTVVGASPPSFSNPADGVDSYAATFRFMSSAPAWTSCPTMSAYFPGDGEISLSTTGLTTNVGHNGTSTFLISTAAPLSKVIVLGTTTTAEITSAGPFPTLTNSSGLASTAGNTMVQRIPLMGEQTLSGFVNSTSASGFTYHQLSLYLRDEAGLIVSDSSTGVTAGCHIRNVTTADIQGFLKKGKCFIATATYRDPDAAPVQMLREFRDRILSRFDLGRIFIRQYYRMSERAAGWLLDHPAFRYPILSILLPFQLVAWFMLNPAYYVASIVIAAFLCHALFWWAPRLWISRRSRHVRREQDLLNRRSRHGRGRA